MTTPDELWQQIGANVRRRLVELTMNQADLIRASGVSDMTVRPIIQGENVRSRPSTLGKIATALQWPPDAFDRMQRGEDPATFETTLVVGSPESKSWDDLKSKLSEQDRAAIQALIESLTTKRS